MPNQNDGHHALQRSEAENRAWLVYQSNSEWIARVDTKASILLALQGVLLSVVVAMTDGDRALSQFNAWYEWAPALLGVALLSGGAVVSVVAVAPRTTGPAQTEIDTGDFLYFGTARNIDPARLVDKLHDSPLPMLSRQIVISAYISSRKHQLVQWSAWLLLAGGLSVGVAIVAGNLT